jgi:hypothetical protein
VRRITRIAVAGIVLLLMACSKADVSGTYLASNPDTAMMLQLAEAPDNRISGQLTFLTIDSSGHLENTSTTVTGAADGSAITLTVQPVASLPIGTTLSGSQKSGGQLTLNGPGKDGQASAWTLEPSTFFVFQTLAARLRARSADILKTKAGQATLPTR